jgi:hypothetical protein
MQTALAGRHRTEYRLKLATLLDFLNLTGLEKVDIWRCGAGWVIIALLLAKWRRQMGRKIKSFCRFQ